MPGGQYQVAGARLHHSLYSLTDSSDAGPEDEETDNLTPLEKLTRDMCTDEETIKELIIGRRIGFYMVRGEIGYGTFSRVKLAFHALTRGRWMFWIFKIIFTYILPLLPLPLSQIQPSQSRAWIECGYARFKLVAALCWQHLKTFFKDYTRLMFDGPETENQTQLTQ